MFRLSIVTVGAIAILFFLVSPGSLMSPGGVLIVDEGSDSPDEEAYFGEQEDQNQSYSFENVSHHYSSVNPFNSDETLLLLMRPGGFLEVRKVSGEPIKDDLNTFGIFPKGDPLWSKTDPHLIYFHTPEDNQIKSFNVETSEVTTISTLSHFSTISFGNGEGDIANHTIPIIGDGRYALFLNLNSNQPSPSVDLYEYTDGTRVDVFDVFQSGKYGVAFGLEGGTHIFDRDMRHVKTVLDYGGHSDRGVDENGNDVLVITNSNDPTPIANCENGIVKVSIPEGVETCLLELDWALTPHVSCNVDIPWCLISTYGNVADDIPYENELVLVSLKDGSVISLGKTGTVGDTYESMPRAALSGKGNFVVFDTEGDVFLRDISKFFHRTNFAKRNPRIFRFAGAKYESKKSQLSPNLAYGCQEFHKDGQDNGGRKTLSDVGDEGVDVFAKKKEFRRGDKKLNIV